MLHLEPDGLGERAVQVQMQVPAQVLWRATKGCPQCQLGLLLSCLESVSPVAFSLLPRAKDKIHLSKSILRGICRWI